MAGGLPALINAANTAQLLFADARLIANLFGPPAWGLYLNGQQVIQPDAILDIEVRADWRVSDYPQEQGAFASYNKVAEPWDVRLRFAKGGALTGLPGLLGRPISSALGLTGGPDVAGTLQTLTALAGTTTLVDVVTPQQTLTSMTVEHFDYRRNAASGVSLLTVDVWLRQIRVTAGAAFTSTTATPSGADAASTGSVQPQTADNFDPANVVET
jgi:hypothetical protein